MSQMNPIHIIISYIMPIMLMIKREEDSDVGEGYHIYFRETKTFWVCKF